MWKERDSTGPQRAQTLPQRGVSLNSAITLDLLRRNEGKKHPVMIKTRAQLRTCCSCCFSLHPSLPSSLHLPVPLSVLSLFYLLVRGHQCVLSVSSLRSVLGIPPGDAASLSQLILSAAEPLQSLILEQNCRVHQVLD